MKQVGEQAAQKAKAVAAAASAAAATITKPLTTSPSPSITLTQLPATSALSEDLSKAATIPPPIVTAEPSSKTHMDKERSDENSQEGQVGIATVESMQSPATGAWEPVVFTLRIDGAAEVERPGTPTRDDTREQSDDGQRVIETVAAMQSPKSGAWRMEAGAFGGKADGKETMKGKDKIGQAAGQKADMKTKDTSHKDDEDGVDEDEDEAEDESQDDEEEEREKDEDEENDEDDEDDTKQNDSSSESERAIKPGQP